MYIHFINNIDKYKCLYLIVYNVCIFLYLYLYYRNKKININKLINNNDIN